MTKIKEFNYQSFYFVHSFGFDSTENFDFCMTTNYFDRNIVAMCGVKNTIGFQFHPERSGKVGLKLLSRAIGQVV